MSGWLLGLSLLVTSARAELVDRILYVVGSRVVTASDVVFEADLDPHDQSPIAPTEDPAYPIEQRLVDYAILRELAGDTSIYKPDARAVRLRYEAVRASFDDAAAFNTFLRRWGLDEVLLQGFLSSRMVVERYIARNAQYQAQGDPSAYYQAWLADQRLRVLVRKLP